MSKGMKIFWWGLLAAGIVAICCMGCAGSGNIKIQDPRSREISMAKIQMGDGPTVPEPLSQPLSQPLSEAIGGGTVTLAWERSASTNVTGYTIYSGGRSGDYTNSLSLGNVTNVTVAAVAGTNFYAVKAHDGNGVESDFSNEVRFVPAAVGGVNTNTVTVMVWLEGATNLLGGWQAEWDLPIKFWLSNQPPAKFFRSRVGVGWNQ